ncbi:MAG: hypothetical protein ACRDVC_08685 [Acidimicrobiales bacterium]
MIRNITMVIAAAVAGAGIWLLTRVGNVVSACNTNSGLNVGVGLKPQCENSLTLYFLGFAFTIGGMVILFLAVWAMKRHRRTHGHSTPGTTTAALDRHFRETYHDVS